MKWYLEDLSQQSQENEAKEIQQEESKDGGAQEKAQEAREDVMKDEDYHIPTLTQGRRSDEITTGLLTSKPIYL